MSAPPSEPAAQIALSWARTLPGLRDTQLQVGWLREQLVLLGPARAADVLTIVLAYAERQEARYATLLLRTSLALAAPELHGEKRAIAYAAQVHGQAALARFLGYEADAEEPATVATAASTQGSADREPNELKLSGMDPAMRRAIEGSKGRPLSLGERKSLARRRDRGLLTRAVRDPHPDVIAILLDNPALTELDVIRLCAQRPVQPEVLALVFRHARWIVRYRVRLTLALNPFTPDVIALQLLPHLTAADRRAVARSADIPERVRAACELPSDRLLH